MSHSARPTAHKSAPPSRRRGRCRRYRWKASNMRQKFQLPLPEGGVQMHPGFLVRQSNGRSKYRGFFAILAGRVALSTHSALLPFPLKLLLLEFCPFMAPGISHVCPKIRGGGSNPKFEKLLHMCYQLKVVAGSKCFGRDIWRVPSACPAAALPE